MHDYCLRIWLIREFGTTINFSSCFSATRKFSSFAVALQFMRWSFFCVDKNERRLGKRNWIGSHLRSSVSLSVCFWFYYTRKVRAIHHQTSKQRRSSCWLWNCVILETHRVFLINNTLSDKRRKLRKEAICRHSSVARNLAEHKNKIRFRTSSQRDEPLFQ